MPPGCEAALLACDLRFPGLLMQRLCSGTAAKWISAAPNRPSYPQDPYCLILWSQPGPGQPSPFLSLSEQNQALEKNLKNMNKCAQITAKYYQQVCKNDTFSRVTPNMKNCDWTAQAAADGGSSDPENHEKEQKKRPANQHSPRTRFFVKITKSMPNSVP